MDAVKLAEFISPKTLVVAHDAGSARIISENLTPAKLAGLTAVIEGPAIKLLSHKVQAHSRDQLNELVLNATAVLLATGWQSDLIGIALKQAKKSNVKTIGLVDRNMNFELRFSHQNRPLAPDLILLASNEVPVLPRSLNTVPVHHVQDVSSENLIKEIKSIRSSVEKTYDFLFIGQPVISKSGLADFEKQFLALRDLRKRVEKVKRIVFRPHPSQTDYVNELLPEGVIICNPDESIAVQIAKSETVIGFDSFLIDIAEAAKVPCKRIDDQGLPHGH